MAISNTRFKMPQSGNLNDAPLGLGRLAHHIYRSILLTDRFSTAQAVRFLYLYDVQNNVSI